jgi:hypothetical protein
MEVAGFRDDALVARMTARVPARVAALAAFARILAWMLDVIGRRKRKQQVGLGL